MAVTVQLNITFPSAAVRDAAMQDFARVHVLDIYSDTVTDQITGAVITMGSIVSPAKVIPAIEKFITKRMKSEVVDYRAGMAAKNAAASARASETTALNGS